MRIGKSLAVEALDLEALVEANVGDGDTKPGHQTGDGGHYRSCVKFLLKEVNSANATYC